MSCTGLHGISACSWETPKTRQVMDPLCFYAQALKAPAGGGKAPPENVATTSGRIRERTAAASTRRTRQAGPARRP
ncbi:hypothetical protein [Jeongeupia chitinilytica]|uniref:Uncharacterized protein n=1 Tax=Jeongeupia chitinilytica TaxID=1041641 RepID=A0ABQ3H2W3_9NEIS|nr:hypothetical protein [Jeongeupia chitinilytica]GHD67594.1 hypothetical protein GCM10007350_31500 [Jeongeupia chitinilytica]